MRKKMFRITLASLLLIGGVLGCTKKLDEATSTNSTPQPLPQISEQNPQPATQAPSSPLDGWQKFSSIDGKFTVLFPRSPQEKVKAAQGPGGEATMHAFVAPKDAEDVYGVSYYDLPEVRDQKLILAEFEQSMIAGREGKIVSFKRIQAGDNPGTEFEFAGGGKANYSMRVRLILVGNRIYALLVICLTSNPNPDERDAFFNSFSLLQN